MRLKSVRTAGRQKMKALLDKLCAAKVKARDGYKCRLCSSGNTPQWAHLFSRRYLNTRWDLDNSWTLCRACHFRYTKRPEEWMALLEQTLGREKFEDLRARAFAVAKVDYQAIKLYLEAA